MSGRLGGSPADAGDPAPEPRRGPPRRLRGRRGCEANAASPSSTKWPDALCPLPGDPERLAPATLRLVADRPRRARPRLVEQAVQAPLQEARPPAAHRLAGPAQLPGHDGVALAGSRAQHHIDPAGQGLRRRRSARPAFSAARSSSLTVRVGLGRPVRIGVLVRSDAGLRRLLRRLPTHDVSGVQLIWRGRSTEIGGASAKGSARTRGSGASPP